MCESLRRFGGELAESPVSAYRPRAGDALSGATRAAPRELGVELIEDELNTAARLPPDRQQALRGRRRRAPMREELDRRPRLGLRVRRRAGAPRRSTDGLDGAAAPVGKVQRGHDGPRHDNEAYWQRPLLARRRHRPAVDRDRRCAAAHPRLLEQRPRRRPARCRPAGRWLEPLPPPPRRAAASAIGPDRLAGPDQPRAAPRRGAPERVDTLPWTYNYRITRRGRYGGPRRRARAWTTWSTSTTCGRSTSRASSSASIRRSTVERSLRVARGAFAAGAAGGHSTTTASP